MRAKCLLAIAGVLAVSACVLRPAPELLQGAAAPVRERLEALRSGTGDALLSPGHPARMACLVEHLTFPGAASLAAMGSQPEPGRSDERDGTEGGPPSIGYEEALERLQDRRGIRVNEEQAGEALEILRSGQWQADLAHVLASLLDLAQQAPARAIGDVTSLHALPEQLGVGILTDARGLLAYRRAATLTLAHEERLREVPEFGRATLAILARTGTYRELARTSDLLLENDSVRLALIIYAQSHGIEIDDDDLDRVREALRAEDPGLAPLLAPAAEALAQRYAGEQGVALLERLAKRSGVVACR